MHELLREWRDGGTLVLTLNRPERANALEFAMLAALARTLKTEGARAGCVILQGAGGNFSSGFDFDHLRGTTADLRADAAIGAAAQAIAECPAPVIARLTGHCHGAAAELAMTADLRIAATDLQLSLQAIRMGVVYRFELMARLVQMCGLGRAQDLLFALPTLQASEARDWGLVSEVIDLAAVDARIAQLAAQLSAAPKAAVRGTKANLRLLVKRAVQPQDRSAANRVRRAAAGSMERRQALAEARERLARRKRG